ncbi:unnamed protein product [Phytophthora lilii]|uniref:Unnamed protein product n=1 Tax=Phytophthora lilii TaxID=2077276 RepID=A0A9W6UA97_9STRA|nr:unnamed protein product [Phytophthora lilii]
MTKDRTLSLSTYSEDTECSNVVYARIDNVPCTDTSVCSVHNDDDGSFHDTEMTACITDREAYLQSAFNDAPYLTIELYPTDCLGKSYNTRSFLADGACHPYAHSHFKVVQVNGSTSVWSADSGCQSNDWYEEWTVLSATELNTEACVSDDTNTWKVYYVEGKSSKCTDTTTSPSATVATSTAEPAATTTAPTADASLLASSPAISRFYSTPATVLLINVALVGVMAS